MTVPTDDGTPDAAPRPRIWVVVVAIVAVAAVAFAIGRFTAFGAGTAPAMPSTISADAGFARDMQVHHAQAIDLAMDVYRKTDDAELRAVSYDIATAQAGQRGEMFGWLVEWGLPQTDGQPLMSWMQGASAHAHGAGAGKTDEQLREEMGMATPAQVAQLQAATGREAECLFLSLMIRHHEGAIPMAQAVIELGEVPRVKTVAEAIVAGQTTEIAAMRDIQSRLGCTG